MATVFDYSRALAKALRESDEARRLRGLGVKIKKDARLEKLLRDLRQVQYDVQVLQVQGKNPGKDVLERMQKLAKAVEAEQALVEYLAAEHAYGQMLSEVQQVLEEVFSPDVPGSLKQ